MTTFYFIRHGNIDRLSADFDPALTSLGIAEAEATAQRLAEVPADRIFASHLRRARETAQTIAARHNMQIVDDPRLRERANYGDSPGQTVDESVAMWERCNVERTWTPPVGDSSRGCGARVKALGPTALPAGPRQRSLPRPMAGPLPTSRSMSSQSTRLRQSVPRWRQGPAAAKSCANVRSRR